MKSNRQMKQVISDQWSVISRASRALFSLAGFLAFWLNLIPAHAASVTGTLKNPDGTGFTNVVLFRPKLDRAVLVSSTLTPYVDTRVTPGTNGSVSVDLRAGDYLVYAGASRPFSIAVPDSTNSYELTAIVTGTNILSAGPFNIVSTTVGNATSTGGGKVKTDATSSDPVVYLKTSADTAIAAATAAVGATNQSSPWVLARYWGLTNYYSVGDSHTYGGLASGPFTWTDSSSRILSGYRYADQLSATNALNHTNLAVSGSSHLFPQIASGPSASHLNQIGRNLDAPTWSGVITTMGGFNDALPTMASDRWIRAGRLADAAMIARLFATNYTVLANGRTATGGTNSTWSTTGTVLSGGGNAAYNPFPWGTPGTDDRDVLTLKSGARAIITPTSGQTVLIYELTTDGGTASVWINGTNVVNLDTTLPLPATTQRMPAALFIPYSGAQIIVTNTAGTNYLSALVQLPAPSDCTNRIVIIGAPIQLSTSVRSASVAKALGDAAWGAAVQFADYPIFFADANTLIDPVIDVIGAADPNHFNPGGQRKIFKAFMGAARVAQNPRRNAFQGSIGDQVVINGSASGTVNLAFARQFTNRVEMSANASGDLIAAMIDAAGNSTGTAFKSENSTLGFTSGGFVRSSQGSGFSGGNVYAPASDWVSAAHVGGNGYLLSLAGGSTSTKRPMIFWFSALDMSNAGTISGATFADATGATFTSTGGLYAAGGLSVGGIPSAVARNAVILYHTGGTGYIASLTNGSLSTTLPLGVYSSTLSLANAGPITGASFTSPYLANATASTVTTSGGLYSAGGLSVGGIPSAVARDAVLLYSTGGRGYIGSLTNGSLSTTLPLSVVASSLSLDTAGPVLGAVLNAPALGAATATSLVATNGVTASTLTSTVSSGTPPLTVTSTTVVPNLNVSQLGGIASSGYQPASAGLTNLASKSTTGAGNIVLATSPTLISPALGDATGASLTTSSGIYAAGGLSVGGVPLAAARNAVLLYHTGGRGYVGSFTNGSLSTLLPMSFVSSSLDLSGAGQIGGAQFLTPVLGDASSTSITIGASGTALRNVRAGFVTLVAGSKTVTDTATTGTTRYLVTPNIDGGTPGWCRVSARSVGSSFTITSSSGSDTSTVSYWAWEP